MTMYILIKDILKSKLVNKKHSSNSVCASLPKYQIYEIHHWALQIYSSTCPCMKIMVVVGPLLVMVILNF
jgi:hypothetical protein